MAKWQRVLLDLAIVLGAFVAGCVVYPIALTLWLIKIYPPLHRPSPGIGAFAGGVSESQSLLAGLYAGLMAAVVLFLRKSRVR